MAGITLSQAETKLSNAMTALDKAMELQSYSVGGRSASRPGIEALKEQVEYWDRMVKRLSRSGGGIQIRGATPL